MIKLPNGIILFIASIFSVLSIQSPFLKEVKAMEPDICIEDAVSDGAESYILVEDMVFEEIEQDPVISEPIPEETEEPVVSEEIVYPISESEIDLIALVTMAEAEGECEEGKRLVIDTILNRVDSAYFPSTVYDVLYQPNQFSCMWTDRIDRCEVREDIVQLVKEELINRTNSEVVFFRTQHYHTYGVPLFQVGNHYFSKYE